MRNTATPPVAPDPPPGHVGPAGRLRSLGNLLNLSTPLGLAIAWAGRARIRPGPSGLLLAEGYRFRFPTGCAFTVGDVVLTRGRFTGGAQWSSDPGQAPVSGPSPRSADLATTPRPLNLTGLDERVLAHEGRHAWQWFACGPAFLPAYALALGWSWWRTGDPAAANVFERLAGLTDGGYAARQPRRGSLSGRSGPRRPR